MPVPVPYNIFMNPNVSHLARPEEQLARTLALIGQPARIQILYALGEQETCVCHLVTALNLRQASISQHLMALREAGIVSARRDGRNIFYQITQPAVLDVLGQAAALCGLPAGAFEALAARPVANCPCPRCSADPSCQPATAVRDRDCHN
jgi:ArsR family transcriptional regulator